MSVVEIKNVSRTFKKVNALKDVTVTFPANSITGLLGRNGAGKTTLMSVIAGHDGGYQGEVLIDGERPFEHASTLNKLCFIRDNQRYPDDYQMKHILRIAASFYPNWDEDYALKLVTRFRIPTDRTLKKLSRGQLSSVAAVIGLASRAEVTVFDEPYLGLDVVARQRFYDELIDDYSKHPRTIIISTHLISELDQILEHVVVLDDGELVLEATTDEIRGKAKSVIGAKALVDEALKGEEVLSTRQLSGISIATVIGLSDARISELVDIGLTVESVGIQDYVAALGNFEHEEEGA